MKNNTTASKYSEVETAEGKISDVDRMKAKLFINSLYGTGIGNTNEAQRLEIERLQDTIARLVLRNNYLESELQRASDDNDLATNRLKAADKMNFDLARTKHALKKQLSERDKKINTYKVCVMQQQECISNLKAQIKGMERR